MSDFPFIDDYPEGLDMGKFEHLPNMSVYNSNHYKGVQPEDILPAMP